MWVTLESKRLKDLGRDDGRKEWEQSAAFKVWTSRSRKGTKNTWREADEGGSSSSDGQPVSQLENQKQWQVLLQKLCIPVFHNVEQVPQVINCSFLGETLMTYCELSYVPLGHQVMLVLWSDAVTYPLQDTTPQQVSGQTRSHFKCENVTSEERGNSQESAGRFQGFRNSPVSREARSFSPFWFRSGDWHWLCSDQIADFTQWNNTCFQSGCEQILIGSTCCQRNVGGASVVANDSRSMLHLMITITELAKLWSDGFFHCFIPTTVSSCLYCHLLFTVSHPDARPLQLVWHAPHWPIELAAICGNLKWKQAWDRQTDPQCARNTDHFSRRSLFSRITWWLFCWLSAEELNRSILNPNTQYL